ncbi:MAG: aldo/keto reductase [SAR202 cluster bacterium]|nr:aldo/keto reductase [SAR202 cluster bacterium]
METRTLGKTGLKISRLGMGLAAIGEEETLENIEKIASVLNTALDGGITFFDTAECYFDSEEMVGRTISNRRNEFTLATKCGHAGGGQGQDAWGREAIAASIDRSLKRLRTDRVDIVQLHSCEIDVLEKGECIRALQDAKKAGKTRFIGYSGDNEAAMWAVKSGHFDTLQTSFSLADQRPRHGLLTEARKRNMGVIAKRPIANGAWGAKQSPSLSLKFQKWYADEYFKRCQAMAALGPVTGDPGDGVLMALGFVFAHPEVDVAIVGTRDPGHMRNNIALLNKLPVPKQAVEELRRRWDKLDDGWTQEM